MKFSKLLVIAALLGGAHLANACANNASGILSGTPCASVTAANDVRGQNKVCADKRDKVAEASKQPAEQKGRDVGS